MRQFISCLKCSKGEGRILLPSSNEIHIWNFSLASDTGGKCVNLRNLLSLEERKKMSTLYFYEDQCRYALARSKLRVLLGAYLGVCPESVLLSVGEYGKPFIRGSSIKFNVSHSLNRFIVAVTVNREVGIDIESVQSLRDFDGLSKITLSAREQAIVSSLPEPHKLFYFYQLWTRKEAYLKAVGTGIVEGILNSEVLQLKRWSLGKLWLTYDLFLGKSMAAAVVVEGENCKLAEKELVIVCECK